MLARYLHIFFLGNKLVRCRERESVDFLSVQRLVSIM